MGSLSWRGDGVVVRSVRRLGLVAGLIVGLLVLAPVVASAEPLCTDSWVGPSEGHWETAADWSAGKAPSSSDVVCVGAGTTVTIGEASFANVLEDKGTLVISGGSASLEVSGALEPSHVVGLALHSGTLTGAGTLNVSGSLSMDASSKLVGSGSTVLGASASGLVQGQLKQRLLVNEGSLTLAESELFLFEGAEIKNYGTFELSQMLAGQSSASFVNLGHFRRTSGPAVLPVELGFVNEGTVETRPGP